MQVALIAAAVVVGVVGAPEDAPSPPAAPSLVPAAPSPPPSSPSAADMPPLAELEAEIKASVRARCVSLAKDALRSGRLEPLEYAGAWLVRGRCHVLQDDADLAARSYAVAVRVQPDIALPTDDAVLARAKAQATPIALVARAVPLDDGKGLAIEARLIDDIGVGDHLEVRAADDAVAATGAVEIATGPEGRVERFTGVIAAGASVVLVDKYGNRLRRVAVALDDDARAALARAGALPPAPPLVAREVSALAYVGGATIATSFAIAAVCGINHTVVAQADEARVLDDELPWLVGFGVGTVGVIVGMGLVAVERLSGGPAPPAAGEGAVAAPTVASASVAP